MESADQRYGIKIVWAVHYRYCPNCCGQEPDTMNLECGMADEMGKYRRAYRGGGMRKADFVKKHED